MVHVPGETYDQAEVLTRLAEDITAIGHMYEVDEIYIRRATRTEYTWRVYAQGYDEYDGGLLTFVEEEEE